MKTGDEVLVKDRPEYGKGTVIRFYANQSTALVQFDKLDKLTYCTYESLVCDTTEVADSCIT